MIVRLTRRGSVVIEYLMLIVLIGLAIGFAADLMGDRLRDLFVALKGNMSNPTWLP